MLVWFFFNVLCVVVIVDINKKIFYICYDLYKAKLAQLTYIMNTHTDADKGVNNLAHIHAQNLHVMFESRSDSSKTAKLLMKDIVCHDLRYQGFNVIIILVKQIVNRSNWFILNISIIILSLYVYHKSSTTYHYSNPHDNRLSSKHSSQRLQHIPTAMCLW